MESQGWFFGFVYYAGHMGLRAELQLELESAVKKVITAGMDGTTWEP